MWDMTVEQGGDSIHFLSLNQQVPKLVDVTLSTNMTIPAFSETVILAKLASPHKGLQHNGYTGVFCYGRIRVALCRSE